MSMYSHSLRPQYDPTAFLKTISLFTNLKPQDLEEVTRRISRHTYPVGSVIFHQNTPGAMLYMIEEGSVRVFGVGLTGQEHTFNTFSAGEIFGELSILDSRPRSASAMTMSPSVIWLLSRPDLDVLFERCPPLARNMMVLLAERVRTAASHVEAIIFQDVQGRLAYELLLLAAKHGAESSTGTVIDMPLTQSDLATIVGATRESVNKALTYLRGRNLIQVDGTQIKILNSDGLRRILYERGR